jgi:hypothetical protein
MASLSDIFRQLLGSPPPPGALEDRRREKNDLYELLGYADSPERLAANERYQARPITPMGRMSFDAGYWDIDRLGPR